MASAGTEAKEANEGAETADPAAGLPVEETDSEMALPPGLDSGDIVLFNRRCMSMPPAGAALCVLAKLSHNSRWDHVGIVVRDPRSSELMFLEADFGGVKLRSLKERVKRSKSNEIAVRRLSLVRTDAMREKLFSFATRMLGRPYELGTVSVMARVADPIAKNERERLHALLVDKRTTVREIDHELESAALTVTARRVLAVERARVQKVIVQIESKLINELGAGRKGVLEDAKADLSRVFCSELVAAAYQDLGLLDVYPLASGYNPKDFSSEQTNPPGVHLLKGSRLSKEILLRASPGSGGGYSPLGALGRMIGLGGGGEDSAREVVGEVGGDGPTPRKRQRSINGAAGKPLRVRGVATGDHPQRESRRLIREVLKRTPIYSKVPDEYKWSHLTKSFSARVVEPGQVVFAQGDFDDRIYVIESGGVDRFVTKALDEDPVLVNSMGSRNSFGLTGFSFNCVRGATIRASERTLLWSVDRPTFERFKDTTTSIQAILSEADQRTLRGLLKDHFLFNRLDKLGPNELSAFFLVKFRAGEEIFKQGERGDNFYIIKSGEVERHIRHPRPLGEGGSGGNGGGADGDDDGNEFEWNVEDDSSSLAKTLRPGNSFGELSLMYNAPRAATVRARTDVECWAISAESFHRLNLGHGTQYLRAIFERFASVTKDGQPYMTASDLLNFADVTAFQDEACRERLSALLVRLVTSNRERDPTRTMEKSLKRRSWQSTEYGDDPDDDLDRKEGEVLLDFWEFVRFDLVLNQPAAEMDFAFRLADQNNSGFISLDEIQYLLQDYADIDSGASDMLTGKNRSLQKVFGRDGSRALSAKEFYALSSDILPPTFLEDLQHLTHHMLNMDPSANSWLMEQQADLDEIAFIDPDGSPSVLGSQFVGSSPRTASNGVNGGARAGRSLGGEDGTGAAGINGNNGSGVAAWISSPVAAAAGEQRQEEAMSKSSGASSTSASGIPWAHLVSVAVSGTASRTVVAPLERLKILMQTQASPPRFNGTISGLRLMAREDANIWRAGFRGNGANVLRIVPNAAIQLAVVDILHRAVAIRTSSQNGDQSQPPSKAVSAVAIGGMAGMTAAAATYPLDYVRGRLTVQNGAFEPYRGTVDGLSQSVRQEGFLSLYRGLTPTLLGVFPYVGLSFAMYEMLRPLLPRRNDGSGAPTSGSAIIGGSLASAVGQVAAYPLDTVRRRMQVAGFSSRAVTCGAAGGSMREAFAAVLRDRGVRGFFRGLSPNLLKVAPASTVSFLCYEQMRHSL